MRLKDQVYIVTAVGRPQGMGQGIARVLAGEGADLVLNSTTPANVEAACREVRALGRGAAGVPGDAGERVLCQQLVEAALDQFGRLDGLVCNAGINASTSLEETSEEAARKVVEVNFFSTFHLCQLALPHLKERGGSVVVVTSVHAESAYPNSSIYNFTKAGLNQFAATLGLEWARYGIRVNALEPGWIRTPGSTGDMDDETAARAAEKRVPSGRMGQAEEIGQGVAFLLSDQASYVTASTLRVDGGLIAAEQWRFD